MNILYLSHEGGAIGGSTESLINMIKSLGSDINPIVIIPSQGEASDKFEKLGIAYFVVPFKMSITDKIGVYRIITFLPRIIRDYGVNFIAIRKITNLLIDKRIDVVHTNTSVVGFGDFLSKKIGSKHVWHLREFQISDFGLNPVLGRNNFTRKIKRTDAVICISKSVLKFYKMQNNNKAVVVYDAVRCEAEVNEIQKKRDYILFAGTVSKGKGIEDAIKAFSIIHKEHKSIKFIVAGSVKPDYLQYLTALIEKLKIVNNVEFIGFQKDINALMSKAICLLMCSKNEGLGRVTIEAMFNGCPVVGYANAGTEEIINHEINGFLYNTEEELVYYINYLIQNKNSIAPLLLEAQKFARKNFTEEVYSKKVLNFYKSLLV